MVVLKVSTFFRSLHKSVSVAESEAILLIKRLDYFLSNKLLEPRILLPLHAYSITTGHAQNKFLASKLIESYGLIDQQLYSSRIFVSLDEKDVFLWNSIIKAHFSTGNYGEAVDFFTKMRFCGEFPNQFTIPMVVSACAELGFLSFGMCAHCLITKVNLFHDNTAAGTSLVYMYSKCGFLESASHVFDEMSTKDFVAWTALVIGFIQNGENEKGLQCLCEMHRTGGDTGRVNFRSLEGGLQACGNPNMLTEGRCLHALSLKTGILCSHVVQSATLSMYTKCGDVRDAWLSFNEVDNKDLFSWTSIMGVYARIGWTNESFNLYLSVQDHGLHPDRTMISCMVSGFANSMSILEGKAFHCYTMRRNHLDDHIVCNSFLSMYLKFGMLAYAENMFALVKNREKECWNLMIIGYGKAGMEMKCLDLFREQQYQGAKCSLNSLISVVSSCAKLGSISFGRSVHCHIFRSSWYENSLVANSLINMYGKCGHLALADRIFHLTSPDIASWNSLISSYVDNGSPLKAVNLFNKMISGHVKLNIATLVIVLSACAHLASVEEGKRVHDYVKREGIPCDVSLGTALVDMYAKCGEIEMASEVFRMLDEKDVVSWNAMISCYAIHGCGKLAIEVFQQMEEHQVYPNSITFLVVLSACAHAGLLHEAKAVFATMMKYPVEPSMKHYGCLVDLYGRYGLLEEAKDLVLCMPFEPDGGVWGSLLSACKVHNDFYMGMKIAKKAIEADPENDGYYILLSDFYSSLEMWDEVEQIRQILKSKGLRKTLGWSSCENGLQL